MYDKQELNRIEKMQEDWEATTLKQDLEKTGELKPEFTTSLGIPVKRIYTPLDLKEKGWDYTEKLGFPGQYPMTRGRYSTGYRGHPWVRWLYTGFGTAEDTNKRLKFIFEQGAQELGLALQLPTQLGLDSDNPLCRGEVGKIGVPLDSLQDVEILFDGIPLEDVMIFTTANSIGAIMYGYLAALAEHRGVPLGKMRLNIQNEPLKEFVARGTYIYPPRPSVKFSVDLLEYVIRNNLSEVLRPYWFCGYHMREGGATVTQEMAFTLADAVAYLDELVSRGVDINGFLDPEVNLCTGSDFFEGICEHRAFRRMWAKLMKGRYNATNPRTLGVYFRGGSHSSNFTVNEPLNNIARGTLAILAQVLEGCQNITIGALDEALSIPTELTQTVILRTQQIIEHESGVINTVDPLAGSYYVEALTDELEERAWKLFDKVQEMGGAIPAIETGFMQRQIVEAAYQDMRRVESGERIIVGVNMYRTSEPPPIKLVKLDETAEERQVAKLKKLRKERDNDKVKIALKELKEAAIEGVNMVPPCIAAVKAYATLGEMCGVLRGVYGEYRAKGLW